VQNYLLKSLIERCSDPSFHEYVRSNTEKAFEEYGIKIPGVTRYRTVVPERGEFILVLPPLDDDK
jgi:hypothetical protein